MASESAVRARKRLFARANAVKPIAEREAEARADVIAARTAAKRCECRGDIVVVIFPPREPMRPHQRLVDVGAFRRPPKRGGQRYKEARRRNSWRTIDSYMM